MLSIGVVFAKKKGKCLDKADVWATSDKSIFWIGIMLSTNSLDVIFSVWQGGNAGAFQILKCPCIRNLFAGSRRFHLLYGNGNPLPQDPATFGCQQDVVFETNAAKVTVAIQFVVVDEILEFLLRLPTVNESRNEIDARLVGDDKSLMQPSAHAQ